MGQPSARTTDLHICPMVTGVVPHVGGPIVPPCAPTVLIGSLPAARIGDVCTCVGPPDAIVKGSATVMIGGKPAARIGDTTTHGGVIIVGLPTVLIGDAGGGGGGTSAGTGFLASMVRWMTNDLTDIGLHSVAPDKLPKWEMKPKGKFEFKRETDSPFEKKFGHDKSSDDDPYAEDALNDAAREHFEYEFGVAAKKSEQFAQFENMSGSTKIRVGSFDRELYGGINGDLSGETHIGVGASAKVAVISVEAEGRALNGLLRGNVAGEALSAEGEIRAGYTKEDKFHGVQAKAGVEATLVKVAASGGVNISPKTVYDNSVGSVVRFLTGDPETGRLSDTWDHGIKFGATGTAGVGAAAKASGRLGNIDGAYGVSLGATVGAGPMAGFSLFVSVY